LLAPRNEKKPVHGELLNRPILSECIRTFSLQKPVHGELLIRSILGGCGPPARINSMSLLGFGTPELRLTFPVSGHFGPAWSKKVDPEGVLSDLDGVHGELLIRPILSECMRAFSL
jgi:hypothetical protein